jgi:hypothetical protein
MEEKTIPVETEQKKETHVLDIYELALIKYQEDFKKLNMSIMDSKGRVRNINQVFGELSGKRKEIGMETVKRLFIGVWQTLHIGERDCRQKERRMMREWEKYVGIMR